MQGIQGYTMLINSAQSTLQNGRTTHAKRHIEKRGLDDQSRPQKRCLSSGREGGGIYGQSSTRTGSNGGAKLVEATPFQMERTLPGAKNNNNYRRNDNIGCLQHWLGKRTGGPWSKKDSAYELSGTALAVKCFAKGKQAILIHL